MQINNYHNKNIILVDDDESILTLIETILHKEGFTNITKARSGETAISLAKEKKPDLIILDIMLPDFDGFEICKKIRTNSMVPIIFLLPNLSVLKNYLRRFQRFSNVRVIMKISMTQILFTISVIILWILQNECYSSRMKK